MKRILIILILGLVLLNGCGEVVCNKPYIQVGTECCLDQDDNSVCDKDEGLVEEPAKSQIVSRERIDARCADAGIALVCDGGLKVKNTGYFTVKLGKGGNELRPGETSRTLSMGGTVIPFIEIEGKEYGCSNKAVTLDCPT